MPVAYNPTSINWNALAGIGSSIGQGLANRRDDRDEAAIAAELSALNSSGVTDYNQMADVLLRHGRTKEATALMLANQRNRPSWKFNSTTNEYYNTEDPTQSIKTGAPPRKTPTAMKEQFKAEDDITRYSNLKNKLSEAKEYLKAGIYEKGLAPLQTELGTTWDYAPIRKGIELAEKVSGSEMVDPEKSVRTAKYLNILGPAAMEKMAEELKGSTAYQELLVYKQLLADPQATNELRAAQLDRMLAALDKDMARVSSRAEQLGGAAPEPGEVGSEEAEYQEGDVADGPNGEVMVFRNGQWEMQ